MRTIFAVALVLCLTANAAEVAIHGDFSKKGRNGVPEGWVFNPYQGHRPYPAVKVDAGVVHFANVRGKEGFGFNSALFDVQPGGKVRVSVDLRGKGRAYFRLHLLGAGGEWFGMTPSHFFPLSDQWQKVEMEFSVTNLKPGAVSAKAKIMLGTGIGCELALRDMRVEFLPGRYVAGKGSLSRSWKLFLPVAREFIPGAELLLAVPETFGGGKAETVHPDGTLFDLAERFGSQKAGNCAWLFTEVEAPAVSEFTIGAGADWWVSVYVNGKLLIDTAESGNRTGNLSITNHVATALLRKGKNVIAVRYVTGKGSSKIHLGGPDDFTGKNAYKIVKHFFADDFERPAPSRAGSPRIISGILSPGLLVETRQGVYRAGSVLIPEQEVRIPDSLSEARFALGFRLYALDGELLCRLGASELSFGRTTERITALLKTGKKRVFSLPLSMEQLPADILFTIGSDGQCSLRMKSLADSSQCDASGSIELPPFAVLALAEGSGSATVDQLYAGLAVPEGRTKSFPFRLSPAREFDPVKAGWKLVFEDDFNGAELDSSNWNCSFPEYAKTDGKGNLVITAAFDQKGRLRSSNVTSRRFFGYGYYEARLKFTRQPGWWASFWLWGTGHHPMLDGIEIDVFEDYYTRKTKDGTDFVLDHNLHTFVGNVQKSWNYLSKIKASEFEDFHTIACKRTPFEISFYLDGKLISSQANHSSYDGVVFDPFSHGGGPAELNAIFSGIIMKPNAWGSSWSNPADGHFPEHFLIDRFRFYEYPAELAPVVRWKKTPASTLRIVRPGADFAFEFEARPSARTGSPVQGVYLMDTGAIIAHSKKPSCRFQLAIDPLHYENTPYMIPGRSGIRPSLDGLHGFSALALDANGMASCAMPPAFVLVVPDKPTTPYLGRAQRIPGKLNPAFYDEGGNGAAYLDDRGNFFNKPGDKPFRPGEDVDTAGEVIGRVIAGEWLKYTVEIAQTGNYDISLKCGTPVRGREHRLLMFLDGTADPVAVFRIEPHASSHWGCDTFVKVSGVSLPAGRHRIVLVPMGLFNFSTLEFLPAGTTKTEKRG